MSHSLCVHLPPEGCLGSLLIVSLVFSDGEVGSKKSELLTSELSSDRSGELPGRGDIATQTCALSSESPGL